MAVTSQPVPTFWLEETGTQRVQLRRFTFGAKPGEEDPESNHIVCPKGWTSTEGYRSGHAALGPVVVAEEPAHKVTSEQGYEHWASRPDWDPTDPRWRTTCDQCGGPLPEQAYRQTDATPLYRRLDTGEVLTLREAPDGALWVAWWFNWKGPDGLCVVAKCPGGSEWIIDGVASNCPHRTGLRSAEYDPDPASGPQHHRCWVRHGSPPGVITIDKNGHSCAAGAGSIVAGSYHGFLQNGAFTPG